MKFGLTSSTALALKRTRASTVVLRSTAANKPTSASSPNTSSAIPGAANPTSRSNFVGSSGGGGPRYGSGLNTAAPWDSWTADDLRPYVEHALDFGREWLMFGLDWPVALPAYVGDDYAADMAAMAADPETQRWWEITNPMQEPLPTAPRASGGPRWSPSSTSPATRPAERRGRRGLGARRIR